MKLTIRFRDYVAHVAAKRKTTSAHAWFLIIHKMGVKPTPGRTKKMVTVDLPSDEAKEIQQRIVMAKVRYCDCTAVAVKKNSSKEWVCERCLRLEHNRLYKATTLTRIELPQRDAYPIHCQI